MLTQEQQAIIERRRLEYRREQQRRRGICQMEDRLHCMTVQGIFDLVEQELGEDAVQPLVDAVGDLAKQLYKAGVENPSE